MKISAVSVNSKLNRRCVLFKKPIPTSFQGKHDCAKIFGSIATGLGTTGIIGSSIIMTGGVALIPVLAYGALCGGIGTIVGHMIDKSQPDFGNIEDESKQ